jgi:AraC-like DNA-binding protein
MRNAGPQPTPKDHKAAWQSLLATCAKLRFEPHDIARQLDARGHYDVEMDDEFPLLIKLFHYSSRRHTRGGTWHERLELFLPLDGPARFRMGDQQVDLNKGDLLVVDNLKLHHVVDFPGFDTRVIVISFRPEFVYSLGSPSHDYAFLLPFYSKVERSPHVLSYQDAAAGDTYDALRRLLECYFGSSKLPFYQAGSKAFFLNLLYCLAAHFRASEVLKWEFIRQQERSLRLKKLFEHINQHSADRLSIREAAKLVGMSGSQFMKTFKQAAGMTLVAYLNHVRLANAARMLTETGRSIAEIADSAGFSDQSYFDKRFRRAFGKTPKQFRAERFRFSKEAS